MAVRILNYGRPLGATPHTPVTPPTGHAVFTSKGDTPLRVSDHQPYMLAWLPYYAKVLSSDLHVVMTEAAYSSEDNFVSRFKVGGMKVTVPIARASTTGGAPTWAIRSCPEGPYLITKAMKQAYGRRFSFRQRLDPIFDLLGPQGLALPVAEFNVRVLEHVLTLLSWDGVLVGDNAPSGSTKVERSVNRLVGAGAEKTDKWVYLCGSGTVSYLKGGGFPLRVSMQSIADPDNAPSILDVLVKYKEPRKFIQGWCAANITWSTPEYL